MESRDQIDRATPGPYEARVCKGIPADCCDYGVVSLSAGREVCRAWLEDDARAIAAALDAALTPGEDIPACTGCGEYPGENVAMLVASLSAKLAAVERERDEAETERTDMMWQRRRAEESAQAIQDELAALSGPAADMRDYHEGIVLAVQSRTKAAEARADRLERQNRQIVEALRFYADINTHRQFTLDKQRERLAGKDPVSAWRCGDQSRQAPSGYALADIELDQGGIHGARQIVPSNHRYINAVLAIARPAILEEAAKVARECFDDPQAEADADYVPSAIRALANTGQETERHTCPICGEPFKPDDLCASDITEGTCHAVCLEGSPVVDLTTGEPSHGPVDTFTYGQEGGR